MTFKEENNKVTAILLAAGGSRRLGQPKQLIIFKNEVLINYIFKQIRKGAFEEIIVVLGSQFREIRSHIKDTDVVVLDNQNWQEGISSSIKCALKHIESGFDAAMFFVVDQPFLEPEIINKILEKNNTSDAKIIAACVNGQITHPVLYKKELFPKLMQLKGDVGGKAIFDGEIIEKLNWSDERLLLDIDSAEDFEKIFKNENYSSGSVFR